MSDFVKKGTVKRTIKYTTKDGEEKNRYVTVGEYWSTDGGNRQAVKVYATLNTDEQWLNIYPLEDFKDTSPISQDQVLKIADNLPTDEDMDKPVDLGAIPF